MILLCLLGGFEMHFFSLDKYFPAGTGNIAEQALDQYGALT